ncbi:MAG: hypothetical protein IKY95_00420 [Bacteroidales bacterium]|nr:hypothetical protein [Bacteroidales bacterium]
MEDNHNLLSSLSSALGEYLNLKADDFRKKTISGLAIGFSRALSVIVLAMLLMMILFVISFALIVVIGNAMGSWSGAAFIIGGVYIIAFAVLYFMRKKLFVGMFTNLLQGVMADNSQNNEWKPIIMSIISYLRTVFL